MSTALKRANEKYALTPRSLDAQLERKARGDRGCVYDLGSGVGILSSFALLIASQAGFVPFAWTYLGIGVWVLSYFLGTRAQSRSAAQRRLAMEQGALLPACVISCEAHLRQSGNRRSGRALVVFAREREDQQGDGPVSVGEGQRKLAVLLSGELPEDARAKMGTLDKVLVEEFCFEFVEVPAQLLEALGVQLDAPGTRLLVTRVVVDPEQLPGGRLDSGDELGLIVHFDSQIAEAV